MSPARSFSGLRRPPDDDDVFVRPVPVGFDAREDAWADNASRSGEELNQDGDRIGFRVRFDRIHNVSGEPLKCGGVEKCGPGLAGGLTRCPLFLF
jgi:hypothetical protein